MPTPEPFKIYLDDARALPDDLRAEGFIAIRAGETVLEIIKTFGLGGISHISFDHDLGSGMSGYEVVTHIERRVIEHGDPMPIMFVHSGNVVGAQNIRAAIAAMERHLHKTNT
jgi:NAD+-processing family protein with receiver domain